MSVNHHETTTGLSALLPPGVVSCPHCFSRSTKTTAPLSTVMLNSRSWLEQVLCGSQNILKVSPLSTLEMMVDFSATGSVKFLGIRILLGTEMNIHCILRLFPHCRNFFLTLLFAHSCVYECAEKKFLVSPEVLGIQPFFFIWSFADY